MVQNFHHIALCKIVSDENKEKIVQSLEGKKCWNDFSSPLHTGK